VSAVPDGAGRDGSEVVAVLGRAWADIRRWHADRAGRLGDSALWAANAPNARAHAIPGDALDWDWCSHPKGPASEAIHARSKRKPQERRHAERTRFLPI